MHIRHQSFKNPGRLLTGTMTGIIPYERRRSSPAIPSSSVSGTISPVCGFIRWYPPIQTFGVHGAASQNIDDASVPRIPSPGPVNRSSGSAHPQTGPGHLPTIDCCLLRSSTADTPRRPVNSVSSSSRRAPPSSSTSCGCPSSDGSSPME